MERWSEKAAIRQCEGFTDRSITVERQVAAQNMVVCPLPEFYTPDQIKTQKGFAARHSFKILFTEKEAGVGG